MWVSEFVHAHVNEWGFFIVVLCFALFLSVVCDGLCVCVMQCTVAHMYILLALWLHSQF